MKRFINPLQTIAFLAAIFAGVGCHAGVVISIDKVTSQAGRTVLLGVYASSTSGDLLSGFNLPFDYNNDGFRDAQNDGLGDLPTGFSFAPTPITNVLYSNTGLDQPRPQVQLINTDSIVTGTGADIALGTSQNPTKLFDLVVVIDPTVAEGTVLPFQIKVPASPFSSLFYVAGPNTPVVNTPDQSSPAIGSITIVAVPEPGSVALVLAVSILAGGICRRRRIAMRSAPRT